MAVYIGHNWISDLERDLHRISCAAIENDLASTRPQIITNILLTTTHTMSPGDPSLTAISKLEELYRDFMQQCPNAKNDFEYLSNIKLSILDFINKDPESSIEKLKKISDNSLLYHHFYYASAYAISKSAGLTKENKNKMIKYREIAVKNAKSAYLQAKTK